VTVTVNELPANTEAMRFIDWRAEGDLFYLTEIVTYNTPCA